MRLNIGYTVYAKPTTILGRGRHTNTGKTSLLRTLLRDSNFGEVKTHRRLPAMSNRRRLATAAKRWCICTTPPVWKTRAGCWIGWKRNTSSRVDGIERLQQFLDSPEAAGDFNQEASCASCQSDMALYGVDAREPVLNKYKDELTVLSWCAKPVMPVFNFIAGQNLDE